MENPGLIVYLDNFLIDPDQLPLSSKYYIAYVIAHEMAHMWFGNLVTLEWWNDAWLNEGFATWVAGEIVLKAFPELNSMDALYGNFTRSVQEDLAESIKPVVRSIKGNDKPLEAFDALSYSKSQVVLRMLENWIGRDNFRFGLQTYFTKYKWSNTTSDDLLNTMAAVTDKPVRNMMKDFIMQPGVPLVTAQVKGNTLRLTQERFKTVEVQENFNQTCWNGIKSMRIFIKKPYLRLS
jgi:aminopeptidase N